MGWLPRRHGALAAGAALVCLGLAACAAITPTEGGGRQAVIDRIVAASAKVTIEQGGRRIGTGSGVVVASTAGRPGAEAVSYVLTAAHILDGKDGSQVFVRFAGEFARRGNFAATVPRRGNAETLDLALLRVTGIAVPPVAFTEEDQARLGEEILVVGFPWGRRLGLFGGIVSQLPVDGKEGGAPDEGSDRTIIVDAAVSSGVSGGGVFRVATGSLLGVVEGYQTASIAVKSRAQTYSVKVPMPGETYVVPMARIRRFLEDAGLEAASGRPERIERQEK